MPHINIPHILQILPEHFTQSVMDQLILHKLFPFKLIHFTFQIVQRRFQLIFRLPHLLYLLLVYLHLHISWVQQRNLVAFLNIHLVDLLLHLLSLSLDSGFLHDQTVDVVAVAFLHDREG